MEDLNKTQVVLLTLFITFVTSVTTGIVTVTLLQQAPQGVTQTINRVVERTIEKVTPVVTKTETKVVGQEDEIIKTASLVKPAIVRIVLLDGTISSAGSDLVASANGSSSSNQAAVILADNGEAKEREIGTGLVVSADGLIATAYSLIPDKNTNYGVYIADKRYTASVLIHNRNDGLAILKVQNDKGEKFFAPQFISKPIKLGQTAIVLGRDLSRYTVSVGLISSLKEATQSLPPSLKTTVRPDETNIGGPLLTSDGQVIGLNLEAGGAIPAEVIKMHLNGSATSTRP